MTEGVSDVEDHNCDPVAPSPARISARRPPTANRDHSSIEYWLIEATEAPDDRRSLGRSAQRRVKRQSAYGGASSIFADLSRMMPVSQPAHS
eukprot:GHVU01057893.1.p1 GENE.GHVU01057893.1~~GHVU01057893.1.p1  ORF type:complete len:104 (+),score=11.81 GHVU01057893.1:37-312(+)